jgi:hypothetical protein
LQKITKTQEKQMRTMNTWKRGALAVVLPLGLATAGCSMQGDFAENTSQQKPAADASLDATVEIGTADIDAMNAISQHLAALAVGLDALQVEGKLDAELDELWSSAQKAGYQSIAITFTGAADEGRVLVKQSTVLDFGRNLDAFSSLLAAFELRSGSLPENLQVAYDALRANVERLGSDVIDLGDLSSSQQVKRLRKARCCMYYENEIVEQCRNLKATRVGAMIACTAEALLWGWNMSLETGRCDSPFCEGRTVP